MSVEEEIPVRPSAGEMEPDLPNGLDDAGADLEEAEADRGGFGTFQGSPLHPVAEEVHQVIGEGMELESEGIGAIAGATEPIGFQVILQFVDPVFDFPPAIMKGEEFGSPSLPVGDETTRVGSFGLDFHLDQDPSSAGPRPSAVEEAGVGPHGPAGASKSLLRSLTDRAGMTPEALIMRDSYQVGDRRLFEKIIELRGSEARIGPEGEGSPGEAPVQTGEQASEFRQDSFFVRGGSATELGSQQMAGVSFEDEEGMIHVGVVLPVEQSQLLVPVSGILGGVGVEKNLLTSRPTNLLPLTEEPLERQVGDVADVRPVHGVFQSGESRLGGQRIAGTFGMDQGLEGGIESQEVRIDRVFVASGNLVDPLAKQMADGVLDITRIPDVPNETIEGTGESQSVIEVPKQKKSRVGRH
jgi:hypothetical protein